jgi:hypothetical protein
VGAQGTADLDFGVFPGKSDTSVAVTGQAGIVSGSLVEAWIRPVDTADHLADEHMVETLKVLAGNIIAGTGFTIYGFNSSEINEPTSEPLAQFGRGGQGTLLYGVFKVSWVWN